MKSERGAECYKQGFPGAMDTSVFRGVGILENKDGEGSGTTLCRAPPDNLRMKFNLQVNNLHL